MFNFGRAMPSTALCLAISVANQAAVGEASGVISALEKKYVVTQTTSDREQITKNGGIMDLKTAGVYTLPSSAMIYPDNKVVEGRVQAPSMMYRMTWVKLGSHVLQAGEKVYITKIESKNESSDDLLRFSVLTVDAIDTGGSQKKFDGIVSFKFKKGYLNETPPEDVETAVESVLAPDAGGNEAGGDNGQQQQGPPQQGPPQQSPPPMRPAAMAAAPPPPPPAPAAAPATINIGESSTEVLQSMGMPLQMVDLGKKKTYIYKTMKVIFINDKVSDVQ